MPTVTIIGEFKCPYCSKPSSIVKDNETGEPALLHEQPVCAEFIEMDVEDTLRIANNKAQDARPNMN